jgi:hypothetical protein
MAGFSESVSQMSGADAEFCGVPSLSGDGNHLLVWVDPNCGRPPLGEFGDRPSRTAPNRPRRCR